MGTQLRTVMAIFTFTVNIMLVFIGHSQQLQCNFVHTKAKSTAETALSINKIQYLFDKRHTAILQVAIREISSTYHNTESFADVHILQEYG